MMIIIIIWIYISTMRNNTVTNKSKEIVLKILFIYTFYNIRVYIFFLWSCLSFMIIFNVHWSQRDDIEANEGWNYSLYATKAAREYILAKILPLGRRYYHNNNINDTGTNSSIVTRKCIYYILNADIPTNGILSWVIDFYT